MVLEEEIDDHEPTKNEILEYGVFLGIELPGDEDLLYIAREALKAPLPAQWKPCQSILLT